MGTASNRSITFSLSEININIIDTVFVNIFSHMIPNEQI